ncbi:enoyl-CoA hydratase/isomerase family protein [Serinicoccus marinus]|uniref:enoyl-CoA hydratase/isomerase family protein n=1 Tax=Serinicoccus marinus TaxID=247333 RepID=UPI00248F5364|nr:enoyl-CoA hydratase/isomerase family protein [Serinicoccus marinus]
MTTQTHDEEMPMDHAGEVRCRLDGDVATLVLTRPWKHNSVTRSMWVQLTDHVQRLEEHLEVRLIVLRGEGSAFSAGADLADMVASAGDPETARAFARRVASALHALATSSKVTVAALKHHVRGGGAELALACDLRVAEDDVAFQIPVSRLGVVPDRITTRRLSRLGGPGVARRVLLLTHELDGSECLRVGLVDELVPAGDLDVALDRLARELRENVDSAVRATKRMLLQEEGLSCHVDEMIEEFVESLIDGGVAERARGALSPRNPTS